MYVGVGEVIRGVWGRDLLMVVKWVGWGLLLGLNYFAD